MDNNWTLQQTKELFNSVMESARVGRGLSDAFAKIAGHTSRSINSVRNYYYSQLKMFQMVPHLAKDLGIVLVKNRRKEFKLFSEEEIDFLIENILAQKGRGRSVRAIITEMAKGEEKLALRLQNKYRSMVVHHKDRIIKAMNKLAAQGMVYYNPYTKQVMDGVPLPNIQKLNEYVDKLDAQEIGSFLSLIRKLM